jgi:hypothetical protein
MSHSEPVENFVTAARTFENWVLNGSETGAAAARRLLALILEVYQRALALPAIALESEDVESCVTHEEWQEIFKKSARLPIDFYGHIFDPLQVPPEEAGVGSLSDDVADIYRDLVKGLRLYDRGKANDAVWEWKFSFESHWGRHAVSAIYALHCWLAAHYEFGVR